MEVNIINQRAGFDCLSEEINHQFHNGKFTSFRALVAYVSWAGIGLIHKELEKFYDKGKKVFLIIGIGNDGAELDVLRYFKDRFPQARISIFYASGGGYTFHPKLYIFSDNNTSLTLLGSNNLTRGGLFVNSECSVKIKIDHNKDTELYSSINEVWKTYANPIAPFSKSNLQQISDKLFAAYPKTTVKKRNNKAKTFENSLKKIFPSIKITKANTINFPKQKNGQFSKTNIHKHQYKELLLEVLKETGAEGTQIQIPKEVITDYFKVPTNNNQTIEIKIGNSDVRPAVICHFPNNTHRISFQEIIKINRPFLMKFKMIDANLFKVKFLTGNEYKKNINKCIKQTRYKSKKWVIY